MSAKVFPSILILINLAAAVVWLMHGNIRMTIYYTAAAVITASVTY